MEPLTNLYELYDKVRDGDREVCEALMVLGVGLETKVSYDSVRETFASAIIQSPLRESFDHLIKNSLEKFGENELNDVTHRLLTSSEKHNTGVYKDDNENVSISLFQKAFEGGQPWAVQEVYELYYYSKAQNPSINIELPNIKQISEWLTHPLVKPENTAEILKTVFSQNYISFSELTNTSIKVRHNMGESPKFKEDLKPIIFDLICLDKNIDNIENRVDAIENKYLDFNINTVYGKSRSLLVAFILNDNLKDIPQLNKRLGLDMNRNFNEEEAKVITSHFNKVLKSANEVAAVENERDLNVLLYNDLLANRSPFFERDLAKTKILNINEPFDINNPIKNLYEYISALDNLHLSSSQEYKDLLTKLMEDKKTIPAIERLENLKEQTTVLMMAGEVQPPRTKSPSLR